MIGIGAALCMVPSCKKSNLMPQEVTNSAVSAERQLPQQDPQVQDATTMYVMLASKGCDNTQRDFTSVIVDIDRVKVFSEEHGWVELPALAGSWDLVRMQKNDIPGFNITDRVAMKAGIITKVAITFGENNKLVVNGKPAECFKLGAQEIMIDLKGEVKANEVNELKLAMNICGNIGTQTNGDGTQCFIMKPVAEFQGITQKMIK